MILFNAFKEVAQAHPNEIAYSGPEGTFHYFEVLNKVIEFTSFFNQYKNKAFILILERSLDLIVAQLAINATCNTFIPLDHLTPQSRILLIASKTKAACILNRDTICFPDDSYVDITPNETKLQIYALNNNDLAMDYKGVSHLFFSSGSTGEPKGIMLRDGPVISVVRQQAKITGLTVGKKFGWTISPGFDASLSDIYSTLLSGATLCVSSYPITKIRSLIEDFSSMRVTHTDLPPSIFPLLTRYIQKSSLESIVFGGELANKHAIDELKSNKPTICLYNAYGPTEATICASLTKVDEAWSSNCIGYPLEGVSFNVALDGELIIGGNHIMVGYLNNQHLTNEKTYLDSNGSILEYKSGDLVEMSIEGSYLYKGRKDRQFKHNGVLISPEEIENNARKAGALAAYCELSATNGFQLFVQYDGDISVIRDELILNLPTTMIPPKIKKSGFKLGLNGKVIPDTLD